MKAAVVGAGRIAEQHLDHLRSEPNAALVGICDVSETLASFAARRFGGRSFTDLSTMLDECRPDVVHVLTPPHLHVEMVSAALEAGAHVVVEKPMALDRAGREALLALSADRGRILVEDHNYRFNRPMLRLQEAVSSGVLGEVTDVEVTIAMPMGRESRYGDANLPSPSHRLPAGFIHEFITHLAYLGLAFADDLRAVDVRWSKRLPSLPSPYDGLDAVLAGKVAVGRLRFTAVAPRASITVRVVGSDGTGEAELIVGSWRIDRPRPLGAQLSPSVNSFLAGVGAVGRSVGFLADRLQGRTAYEGLHTLLGRTYASIADGSEPPVTPSDMRLAGDLVDDLIEHMS